MDLTKNGGIVLFSGAVGAGKSSVAALLLHSYGFGKISTGRFLQKLASEHGLQDQRDVLQKLGDDLDISSNFFWPISVAKEQIELAEVAHEHWLLDAVRKDRQVTHFRNEFDVVSHIHLKAPEKILRARFLERQLSGDSRDASGNYELLLQHPNEIASRSLEAIADDVYDTSVMTSEEIAASIVFQMRRRSNGASGTG